METWDREELYADVWEQPLTNLSKKYGVSAVAIGKVCRKLKIPLPGRGYWARRQHGKPVQKAPLPHAKDLPVICRLKMPPPADAEPNASAEPTDDEWRRIKQVESQTVPAGAEGKQHKLVTAARRNLSKAKPDDRGILQPRSGEPCLDVMAAPNNLDRALNFLNAVLLVLESEGFAVTDNDHEHRSSAMVFGQRVQFRITEKVVEKGRREVIEYSWKRTVIDSEPSGRLEFRVGDRGYGYRALRDGKKQRLEDMVLEAVGAIMREGRALKMRAEERAREEVERQRRAKERLILAEQIREEEKKLQALESWVQGWTRARQMREFVVELEKRWVAAGHDLSPDAQLGQRIIWMKQQADRLDPLVESPASILDRKQELDQW